MEEVKKPSKTPTIILIFLVVILAFGLGFMYMQYNKMKVDSEIVQEALEEQKQSLTLELQDMMSEYEGLKSNNDSLNNQITVQQKRIKDLLVINRSNLEKIKLYKKELVTLRDIMKSYIVQIDSLNTRNQVLTKENSEVKDKLDLARQSNEDLSKEKADLSDKVSKAAKLIAKDVAVTALNKRGKDVEKARKVVKLKACFTIRENSIASSGERVVYMRITRPDGLVLATSEQDLFEFEGGQIVFSAKRVVEYENKDVDLCIFWDNTGEMIEGTYTIDLFCDGYMIGSGSMALK